MAVMVQFVNEMQLKKLDRFLSDRERHDSQFGETTTRLELEQPVGGFVIHHRGQPDTARLGEFEILSQDLLRVGTFQSRKLRTVRQCVIDDCLGLAARAARIA